MTLGDVIYSLIVFYYFLVFYTCTSPVFQEMTLLDFPLALTYAKLYTFIDMNENYTLAHYSISL